MVTGLSKYAGQEARRRASSPKLQVLNTALISAQAGYGPEEARADRGWWGRLVESAAGAHLANSAMAGACDLYYWRDRDREVDFVVESDRRLTALEVKSGGAPPDRSGIDAFQRAFDPDAAQP
jgi:hypothetical protein